jgi:hypothetical protein
MTSQLTRPAHLLPATDEEVAGAYAAAYASADVDALRDLLHPDVVCRLLMPGDVLTCRGADEFIEGLSAAVAGVDGWRTHSSSVTVIGERFATRSRLVLEVDGDRYQLEHQEFVAVDAGRVVAIDGVCSGFRPVATRGSDVAR